MSVTKNELVLYGCANMTEADGVTVGGAVDFTKRLTFFDISAADTMDVVSSSASDTATKISGAGRDSTGAIQTPAAITLNGTTPVTGAQSFERLLYAAISGAAAGGPLANPTGTAAVGDVAWYRHTATISAHTARAGSANTSGVTPPIFFLQTGDGATIQAKTFAGIGLIIRIKTGTGANQLRYIVDSQNYGTDVVAVNRDWTTPPDATSTYDIYEGMLFDISPNPVTAIIRMFSTAAADTAGGASRIYVEKGFQVNNDTTKASVSTTIEVASDSPGLPSGALLDIALATALNDTGTVANRQTAPVTGIGSFVTQPALVSVPSPGNLPPGAAPNTAGAQAIWFRLTLPAGTAAYKGAGDVRVQGTTA